MLHSAGAGSDPFLARMFLEAANVTQLAGVLEDVIKINALNATSTKRSNADRDLENGDDERDLPAHGTAEQKMMHLLIRRSRAGEDGEDEDMYKSVEDATAATRGRLVCSGAAEQ